MNFVPGSTGCQPVIFGSLPKMNGVSRLFLLHCNRARVLPATAGWQPALPRSQTSVTEILEAGGNAKVAAAQELNHGLQVVFLFSRDANLSILQLALHFETL